MTHPLASSPQKKLFTFFSRATECFTVSTRALKLFVFWLGSTWMFLACLSLNSYPTEKISEE